MINKKIIINDLLINYYYLPKNKAKKTLIFLHGWGVDSQTWLSLFDLLKDKLYASYFIDLPGFGHSQTPAKDFYLDDYVNVVENFVKKLDLKNIVLIGHSFGGRITIKLAAKNHDYLEKVVLVDSAGIYHQNLVKTLKLLIASIVRPIFQFSFMQTFRQKIYQLTGNEEYLAMPVLSKTFSHIVSEDLISYLSKIKLSTLIIWGEKDDNEASTLNDAQLMKKNISNSKLELLKDAGHFSFLDRPKEFIKALNDFL